MWKKLGSAGALAHAGASVYAMLAGVAHADLLAWLYTGMCAIGPGFLGLATCLLISVFNPRTRPLLVLERDDRLAA